MPHLGLIRIGIASVSAVALLLALFIELATEQTSLNQPLTVVASPEHEYGALVAALQQQSDRPIQYLPADQKASLTTDWILLTDRHNLTQLSLPSMVEPVVTFIPAVSESEIADSLDILASQQLLLTRLQERLGSKDDMALLLPEQMQAWSSLAEPLQQKVSDAGIAELHLLGDAVNNSGSLERIRGLDLVVTMGNQATHSAINRLKAVEKLQTTDVVAVGFCWSLLDAVNAGTLDGLVFYPPSEIAEQLLAQTRGETPAPVQPVWVDKSNVRQIMARS